MPVTNAGTPDDINRHRWFEFIAAKVGSRAWVIDDGQGPDLLKKYGFKEAQVIARADFEAMRKEYEDRHGPIE